MFRLLYLSASPPIIGEAKKPDNTFKANIIPNSWESLVLSIKYQLAPTVLIPTPNAEIISAKKNNLKFLIFNKSVINITFFQCKIYICELFYKLRVV
ncbi:Uncharacterised protein [Staphylococcus aureus]|nr:Uncharacterised protein [Staphylococcus aureus]